MMKRLWIAGLLGITLLTVTAAPPQKAKRLDKAAMQGEINVQEKHKENLFSDKAVSATGVGVRKSDGKAVVKVYTNSLDATNIPGSIDGVPVQVEYVGQIHALKASVATRNNGNRYRKHKANKRNNPDSTSRPMPEYVDQAGAIDRRVRFPRPVPIGVSAGHTGVTAGTLGCRVSQGCHAYALSNNHVFANENDAQIGDAILQPGKFDGGQAPVDTIGTLFDFVPLNFTQECTIFTCNRIDAALADVTSFAVGKATTAEGYGTPRSETIEPYLGMKVMKYGRTTGLRYGYIDALNAIIDVNYGTTSNTKYARFIYQIIIKTAEDASYSDFSLGGDSGSLIVAADANYPAPDCINDPSPCSWDYPPLEDERKPVALLFAGGGGITVGNKIDDVLATFDVLIDGE